MAKPIRIEPAVEARPIETVDQRLARYMRAGTLNLAALPPLSLYVHLPWCLKKCPYCDFNSHELQGAADESRYLDALRADLEAALPFIWGRRVHSIFIGGGTPSLFAPESIDRLLADIRARMPLEAACDLHHRALAKELVMNKSSRIALPVPRSPSCFGTRSQLMPASSAPRTYASAARVL